MNIEYSLRVRQKLRKIYNYISKNLHNPSAAQTVISRILRGCSMLKEQPQIGMSVERLTGAASEYRYIVIDNYLAVYRQYESCVRIVELFDCRTDYVKFLLDY